MKKVIAFVTLVFIIHQFTIAQAKPGKTPEKVIFSVNMDCHACVEKISKQLTFEKGVRDLYINLENQIVAIRYRPDKTSKAHLKKTLEKMKYEVSERLEKDGLPDSWK